MNIRFGLLLIGATLWPSGPAFAESDGSVDASYGTVFGRTVINTFPGLVGGSPELSALANSPFGHTWLFGSANGQNPNNTLLVARLMADSGLLDSGFGAGTGLRSTTLPAGVTTFFVTSAIVQADGKPIMAGNWTQNGDLRGFVCRLNVAGNLDASYASGGCRALRAFIYANNERCGVAHMVADPADVSVTVTGTCNAINPAGAQRPYLARLTSTGALDVEFGAGAGVTTPTITSGELQSINALAMQSGGRFVGIGDNMRATNDYDISGCNSAATALWTRASARVGWSLSTPTLPATSTTSVAISRSARMAAS